MCVCVCVCVCVPKVNKGFDLPQIVATDFFSEINSASTYKYSSVSLYTSPYSSVSTLPKYLPFVATPTTYFNGLRERSQRNPLPDHLADFDSDKGQEFKFHSVGSFSRAPFARGVRCSSEFKLYSESDRCFLFVCFKLQPFYLEQLFRVRYSQARLSLEGRHPWNAIKTFFLPESTNAQSSFYFAHKLVGATALLNFLR